MADKKASFSHNGEKDFSTFHAPIPFFRLFYSVFASPGSASKKGCRGRNVRATRKNIGSDRRYRVEEMRSSVLRIHPDLP